MKKILTIGKIAAKSEVNVETIRYYQRMNLMIEPQKPMGGFRVYPESDVERIRFIKRAQQLGFTLKEIRELLDLGEGHCHEVQDLAQRKLDKIEANLKDLKSMKKALNGLLKQCKTENDSEIRCAIISSLSSRS